MTEVFSTQRQLLLHCLNALEAAGATPVVLHARFGLPSRITSDVDLVCNLPSLQCARIIAESVSQTNARFVQAIQHEPTWHYAVLALEGASQLEFLALDIGSDLRRSGLQLLDGGKLVSDRQWVDGIPVPSWPVDAVAYFIKRIDKADVRSDDWAYLLAAYTVDPQGVRVLLREAVGSRLASRVVQSLGKGATVPDVRWKAVRRRIRARAIVARPWRAIRGWIADAARVGRRVLQPTGIWIVLQGLDGAGKTTVADAIIEKVSSAFRRSRHAHMFGDEKRSGQAVAPRVKRPYTPAMSLVKAAYLVLRWWVGWARGVMPVVVRSGLVVTERSPVDLVVDPLRFRCSVHPVVGDWVARTCPRADLYVLLRVSPEVAALRKRELAVTDARVLASRYDEAAMRRDMLVVDAERPADEVAGEIAGALLRMMEARALARLGL